MSSSLLDQERTARAAATAQADAFDGREVDSSQGDYVDLPESTYAVREKWEGSVEDVGKNYFVASLINLSSGDSATAEIFVEDVSAEDRDLIAPGKLFYWHIGYRSYRSGDQERVSSIKFKRVLNSHPSLNDNELKSFWLGKEKNEPAQG
jgi:hypothetical protein